MPLPSASFNAADSIVNGLSVIQFKPDNATKTGTTIATSTGVCTCTGHGLKVNQQLIFTSLTGGTGLTANTQVYWVATAPTADTFTVSLTRGGNAAAPSVAATAFTLQPVWVFEVYELTDKGKVDEKSLKRPTFTGQQYKARSWGGDIEEEFEMTLDDIKRQLTLFSGSIRGRVPGKATIWSPDIDDASGKCAMVSETDFPCTAFSSGDNKRGGGEIMKGGLKFVSNKAGLITYTTDASV